MKHLKILGRKSKGHSRILINEKKFWPAVQVVGESPLTREPARRDFAALDYWIVIGLLNTIYSIAPPNQMQAQLTQRLVFKSHCPIKGF